MVKVKDTEQDGVGWRRPALSQPQQCPQHILSVAPVLKSHSGTWVAQSVKRPTSAQVTISRSVSSSPTSGSVLTAQSLELLRIICLPLSLTLPHSYSVSLSLKNK